MGEITKNYSLEALNEQVHKFLCKECCKETRHIIVASYLQVVSESVLGGKHSVDWSVQNQIVQCQGCESVSFRVVSTCSEEWDHDPETGEAYLNESVKFYPGRTQGIRRLDSFLLPHPVQVIYEETILAIENEQNVLAGIGVRALVETVCKHNEVTGNDLYQKINSLRDKAIVTPKGAETLHRIRVLGNEAAHEVKSHNKQQLTLALEIIEHMLDGTYIIPKKVERVFKKVDSKLLKNDATSGAS